MDFPTKRYDIIYADPPWEYGSDSFDGRLRRNEHEVKYIYPVMSIQTLCEIPVVDIVESDCLLFLWSTSPTLPDAMRAGEAWGFKYKTVAFVWDKQNPMLGNYTMSQCEMCLVFKKGNIPQPRGKRNIRQFLSCKKGGHSEKPWAIRDRITEMFPAQSKLEMFARTQHKGWDAWGNELDKEIDLS